MSSKTQYKITWWTGAAIVIANMIGTGVFTSLGFQLPDIKNTTSILLLWLIGGLAALAGAFSYAEVGTVIGKSGGEYTFLSRIYHPVIGYLAGWISISVGFAAPVALAAIAITDYTDHMGISIPHLDIWIIILISMVHSFNLKISSWFQNISTSVKVLFIIVFVAIGLLLIGPSNSAIDYSTSVGTEIFTAAFAIALIFVSYSYTGWNAAAYITEEFRNPIKDLPKALIAGTVVVALLYTLLQFIFLKHAPYDALVGKVEVGAIAAGFMFEERWANLFSGMISLLLISSISAMIWVGPRVTGKMGDDYRLWRFLKAGRREIPMKAIWFQAVISIALILTGTFEQILIYCGILLTLSSAMVVFGVFIVRRNTDYPVAYRSPGYPFWQIIFLLLSLWMIVFAVSSRPEERLFGITNLALGLITYFINRQIEKNND